MLMQNSPRTISQLIHQLPISEGLEELVAYIRIARAVKATELASVEEVIINDHQGNMLRASIPTMLLTPSLFPENIEDLSL